MFYQFIRSYGCIFILPAVAIVFSLLLKAAAGPFWQYADPSYIYLLNSLNLVKGIPSAFFDQPGVPLQSLGQLIIMILNTGHSATSTIDQVLMDPEFYLNAINIVLLALIPLTSILLGAYTYFKTKDCLAVFLSQLPNVILLTLRTSLDHPTVYATVNAEPLLLSVTNLFNLFLLKWYFADATKKENVAILILGFIAGLGIATKLTFLPLLALPLMIAGWRMKPVFILITIVSFVLWTLPIIALYPKLWGWAIELLTHTGVYGNGDQGIIDLNAYLMTWKHLFQEFWFFILFAVGIVTISSIQLIKKREHRAVFFSWAISATILIQFMLIAKHFDEHYLVIVLNSFGPIFVAVYLQWMPKGVLGRIFILALIGTGIIQSAIITSRYASRLDHLTKAVVGFNDMVHSKYPDAIYIGSYLVSPIRSPEYALFMGNDSSGGGEKEELTRLYPKNFSFFTESRDISGTCTYGLYDFKGPVWADDLLVDYSHIIFINSGYDFSDSPYVVKPLEEGEFSKAYLLVGSTEKAANAFFNAAIQELQKGDYPQAFALALKARQLHYQPQGKVDYFLSIVYPHLNH